MYCFLADAIPIASRLGPRYVGDPAKAGFGTLCLSLAGALHIGFVWSRVRALRGSGKTVFITTHYMDEAERLCDRVAIMSGGRKVSEGGPKELIREHLAAEAIEFDCPPEQERALLDGHPAARHRLRAGDRLMLYADDCTPLAEWVRARDGGDRRPLIVRPANLEDVFLSVTGTRLEGGA